MRAATEVTPPPRRRGLSIIELMVAMVVCMMVSLVAVQAAVAFLASQRQGVGAAGSSMNAASALAAIKADLASGGLGFFGNSRFVCSQLNFGVGAVPAIDGAAFAPFRAQRVGANDTLEVLYADDVLAGAAVRLAAASNGTSATLMSLLPVSVGRAVLLSPGAAGTPCLMRTVTAVTLPAGVTKQVLTFAGGGEFNQAAFSTPAVFDESGVVTIIGRPNWRRYALVGTDLTITRPMTGDSATLLRNVVGLRVDYGVSSGAGGSTTVDTWEEPVGTWAVLDHDNIRRVRAMRIGVVVRSPQREKPNEVTGQCEASASKPTLFDGRYVIEPDVADWQCFRFRSAVVVVPLRNVVYGVES